MNLSCQHLKHMSGTNRDKNKCQLHVARACCGWVDGVRWVGRIGWDCVGGCVGGWGCRWVSGDQHGPGVFASGRTPRGIGRPQPLPSIPYHLPTNQFPTNFPTNQFPTTTAIRTLAQALARIVIRLPIRTRGRELFGARITSRPRPRPHRNRPVPVTPRTTGTFRGGGDGQGLGSNFGGGGYSDHFSQPPHHLERPLPAVRPLPWTAGTLPNPQREGGQHGPGGGWRWRPGPSLSGGSRVSTPPAPRNAPEDSNHPFKDSNRLFDAKPEIPIFTNWLNLFR